MSFLVVCQKQRRKKWVVCPDFEQQLVSSLSSFLQILLYHDAADVMRTGTIHDKLAKDKHKMNICDVIVKADAVSEVVCVCTTHALLILSL